METECSGDGLRSLAPRWSLAGDEKLLDILQNTHKKIITKCQEVNAKLEEMSVALDDASISLQNVNNRFLALSNSQFIESRVYDDDADVTTQATPVKEPNPKPQSQESDLEMLKNSLSVLQDLHETVTILKDSDTETDSDDDDGDRVVLRPKDLYSDRPLPYIIGSEAWKNSWHAGLIPEDSDAESGSEAREAPSPQYSDSEPEDLHESKANATISETSSELASEQDNPAPPVRATPADIAADLARRLAAPQPKVVEPAPEFSPAVPVSKTIYRPQQPQTAAIFADEPPPFEDVPSESSDEDIFAELHSSRPKDQKVVEDLFGVTGVFTDYGAKVASQPRTEPRPQLFEEPSDVYVETQPPVKKIEEEKTVSKKPIGGVSLFGNKGAESIGAAILKRNQRKSTSEEESDNEERNSPPRPKTVDQTDSVKTEKDIFEDLFAKSANLEKKKQKDAIKDTVTVKNTVKDKPVDLFSDNLFDDVGDLFTSNLMKNNKSNQKSIFDDDDDLFAEVAAPIVTKPKNEVKNEKKIDKSLFDSDDDLFADKPSAVTAKSIKKEPESNQIDKDESIVNNNNKHINTNNNVEKSVKPVNEVTKINNSESNIKTTKIKSIFDSDSDSDIFADLVKSKSKSDELESKDIFDVNKASEKSSVLKSVPEVKNNVLKASDETKNIRSPSLFDDDDDDLFSETPKIVKKENVPVKESKKIDKEIPNIDEEEIFKVDNEIKPVITETKPPEVFIEKKEEKEIFLNVNQNEASDKSNVFDNDHEENIFEEKVNEITDSMPNEVKDKQSDQTDIHEDVPPKLKENIPNITMENNKSSDQKSTLLQETEHPISKDIFDDEPPVFEKPKEPKRSKNVNALFDDDSEDEALFFRKSDLEEKPENFPSTGQSEAVFGIFHDEPPAIDDFGDTTDIFNTVIPKHNIEANSFQTGTNDNLEPDNVLESVPEVIASKVENKSNESDVNDFDIFEGDKLDNAESDKKPINIHNTFSEIKENEFDDLFKSANKVVDDTDDIFKATSIDAFIKSTESSSVTESNQASKSIQDADLFDSKQSEKPESSAKSKIDFDSDEELFSTLPKPVEPTQVPENTSKDELDKDVKSDIFNEVVDRKSDELKSNKTEEVTVNKDSYGNVRSKQELLKTFEDGAQAKIHLEGKRETDSMESKNNDIKKVGRIKSLNLNIDVATLLPGASPKKNKTVISPKERDSESPSESISDEVKQTIIPKAKSGDKMVKSISFESEPNSTILDNKLSKERARIQVKRRPSTRKARREAVRKSAIDFDDSTDNSSSIDDQPRSFSEKSSSESPAKTIKSKTADSDSSSLIVDGKNILNSTENVAKSIDNVESIKAYNTKTDAKVTSKVVYILNDEDIFDTRPETESRDEDLFKKDVNTPIATLGSVYKAGNIEKPVKNDTDSKNVKKSKASIFDSDSDEELFGGKSKKDDKKKVEVKGSLFGDDEDDDLFGVKSKKADVSAKPQPSKTNSSKEISTEPVFNDPLSMLGDDE